MCCISFSNSAGSTGARGSYIADEGLTFFLMHVVTSSQLYGKTGGEETVVNANSFGDN